MVVHFGKNLKEKAVMDWFTEGERYWGTWWRTNMVLFRTIISTIDYSEQATISSSQVVPVMGGIRLIGLKT
jgi:hypothetical protein